MNGSTHTRTIYRACFVTLEGIDGSGKSVQTDLLFERLLHEGYATVRVRDPGGSSIAEGIRNILLDVVNQTMAPMTELFLYEAARSQLIHECIAPALDKKNIVVSDRFIDSTTAYQGHGRGIDLATIETANRWACSGIIPNRTYILDIPWEVSIERRSLENTARDRMEKENHFFFDKVREGYLAIAKAHPGRILLIDGTSAVDVIHEAIYRDIVSIVQSK